jgi:hypothetical protein
MSTPIPTSSYDTPLTNSNKTTSSGQPTLTSSADYALKVIFNQFEHMADTKMSNILSMGVVSSIQCITFFFRTIQTIVLNRMPM